MTEQIPYPVYQAYFVQGVDGGISVTFSPSFGDSVTEQQKTDLLAAIKAAVASVANGATVLSSRRDISVTDF